MGNYIRGFKTSGGTTLNIWAHSADTATIAQSAMVAAGVKGIGINAKGNLEITNRSDTGIEDVYDDLENGSKVNIVSMGAIQIKPGLNSKGKSAAIAFDNEYNTASPNEIEVQFCNGKKEGSDDLFEGDIMGARFNIAEMVFDTNNAYTGGSVMSGETIEGFDPTELKMKFRRDKWNQGTVSGNTGPIYAKMMARAIDLRCHDHGGIALQIAGVDSDGHENKIKFESDRTSEIGAAGAYCGEGGKGIEFGTFNPSHASLYCGDYRFKADAKVYAASRNTIVSASTGKMDYPTQADDFKDVISEASAATWNDIVGVAAAWKNGTIGGGSSSSGSSDLSAYVTKTDYNVFTGETNTKLGNIDTVSGQVVALSAATLVSASHVFRKAKNGNLEISSENLYQYATEEDPSTEGYTAETVYYTDVTEYNTAKGTELTEEAFAALSDEEKIKTAAIAATAATLDLVSDGKIALKGSGFSFEAGNIVIPVEISKKGKVTVAGVDLDGNIDTAATPEVAKAKLAEGLNISFNVEKSNLASVAATYPEGSNMISVSLATLLGLVERVTALEARVDALENPAE